MSVRHAARFLLVGTMNPEEGELRPQLLDRFGLTVEAAAPRDPATRAEVVRRRLAYDADPAGVRGPLAAAEESGLAAADRRRAAAAAVGGAAGRGAAPDRRRCAPRSTWTGCAPTWSPPGPRWRTRPGRAGPRSPRDDIRAAARLALPHRRRRNPFDAPGLDEQQLDEALAAAASATTSPTRRPGPGRPDPAARTRTGRTRRRGPGRPRRAEPGARTQAARTRPDGRTRHARRPRARRSRRPRSDSSRRSQRRPGRRPAGRRPAAVPAAPEATFRARRLEVPGHRGRGSGPAVRAPGGRPAGSPGRAGRPGPVRQVHLTATLTAAAPHQAGRGRTGPGGLRLRRDDLREPAREGREGNLVLFLVDASGSMAARRRMGAVKGAVLSLLLDAYQRRDKVGLITFRGSAAPSCCCRRPRRWRRRRPGWPTLPTGGRTPLAAGLLRAHEVLRAERLRDPQRRPLLVVVTDGRATPRGARPGRRARRGRGCCRRPASRRWWSTASRGPVRLGLAAALARGAGCRAPAPGRAGAAMARWPRPSRTRRPPARSGAVRHDDGRWPDAAGPAGSRPRRRADHPAAPAAGRCSSCTPAR